VTKTRRNDPCPCGSGKKYKKCCLKKTAADPGPPSPGAAGDLAADLERLDALANRVPDLLARGSLAEAEKVARQLLADYPQEPDGLERMAEVLEAQGEDAKAAAYYRRAARHHLDHDPEGGKEPAAYYRGQAARLDPDRDEKGEARDDDR